jgi:hypothetical protein
MNVSVAMDPGDEFEVRARAPHVRAVLCDVPTPVSHSATVDKYLDHRIQHFGGEA